MLKTVLILIKFNLANCLVDYKMRISFWLPIDFFLASPGNRRRLLDVPLVTEERTGPRHKVVEISWNFFLELDNHC